MRLQTVAAVSLVLELRLQIHQQRGERANLERLLLGYEQPSPGVAERAAISNLWRTARHHGANSVLSAADGLRLITSGWAAWVRYTENGDRLIFLFLIPGDFIIASLYDSDCCEVVSLTPLRTVDATALTDSTTTPEAASRISGSGRRYRLLLIDHLTRLTGGSTTKSVAHLLLEFHTRSISAGCSVDGRFTLPIGQRVIARALGRSSVQVHKIMNRFQADGLIKVGLDWIDVLQPEALRRAAGVTHSRRDQILSSLETERLVEVIDLPLIVTGPRY